jgi:hypothetical protein
MYQAPIARPAIARPPRNTASTQFMIRSTFARRATEARAAQRDRMLAEILRARGRDAIIRDQPHIGAA